MFWYKFNELRGLCENLVIQEGINCIIDRILLIFVGVGEKLSIISLI